jgi:hypothetical protein
LGLGVLDVFRFGVLGLEDQVAQGGGGEALEGLAA